MKKYLTVSAVALAAILCSTASFAAKDNFNRAALGNAWVVTSGSLFITSNQLQGGTSSLGYDKKSKNDSTVSATLYTTSSEDLEYGAVASGNITSGNNAFVKLQSQDGTGTFTYGAFYVGNNGGGSFFPLDSAVPSPAKLSVSFCGTVATMNIKSSAGSQQYTFDYGTTFGNGGGLGTYGSIALDNYKSKAGGGCTSAKGGRLITKSTAKDPSLQK